MTENRSWKQEASGRERVRYVVELLNEPKTVDDIADEAEVSRATADDELERLKSDDWIKETTVDGKKAYDLNPVRMLFNEITDLIEDNSREELEDELTELEEEREELSQEYDADTLQELRESLADENLSADEIRERRNVSETWEAVDSELRLVRHALRMYDDVVGLSSVEHGHQSNRVLRDSLH
jgi:predicted transcriptional regulator